MPRAGSLTRRRARHPRSRRAAASKLKKNVPAIAGPPSGPRGGGHPVPSSAEDPLDLLSGFELAKGGKETPAAPAPAPAPASSASDIFASFAVPPAGTSAPAAHAPPVPPAMLGDSSAGEAQRQGVIAADGFGES